MKLNFSLILSLFVFFAIIDSSQAQPKPLANPQEILAKINAHTQDIHKLQADFVQEKHLSFLEYPVESEGKFWFNQPDQIRWEYQKPYNYVMIMTKGQLKVIDDGNEFSTDLSANKMFEQLNGLISGSIQGKLLAEEKNYQKTYFTDDKNIIVRFVPVSPELKAYLKHIEIFFDKATYDVTQFVMVEPGDDFTRIRFSQRKINQDFSQDVFK